MWGYDDPYSNWYTYPNWYRYDDRYDWLYNVLGPAQGVILIALLAIFVDDDLQRLNGTKNVLAMVVNTVASVLFIIFSTLSWSVVGLIAAGSIIGGQVGARIGRRLPAAVLRGVIVAVGLVVACILFAEWY